MKNLDIRILVMDSGLLYRDIAREVGITPEWLSRCLSKDMKPEMRNRILQAVEDLRKREGQGDVAS